MFLEAQAGWRLSSRKGRKAPKGIAVGRLGFDSRMPKLTVLTGDSRDARNSFEQPDAVALRDEEISAATEYTVRLRPYSVNVIRHRIKR